MNDILVDIAEVAYDGGTEHRASPVGAGSSQHRKALRRAIEAVIAAISRPITLNPDPLTTRAILKAAEPDFGKSRKARSVGLESKYETNIKQKEENHE